MMRALLAALAALHGFFGVVVSAIGAHAVAEANYRAVMTGAAMEIAHALAALVALLLVPGKWAEIVAGFFVAGALLFAGAIDLRVFADLHTPLAPVGGTVLMAGWLLLAVAAARASRDS